MTDAVTSAESDLPAAGGDGGEPLYVLMMEVALPSGGDADELAAALRSVGGEQGVDVSVRPLEQDAL
jgi:hypothetical protein